MLSKVFFRLRRLSYWAWDGLACIRYPKKRADSVAIIRVDGIGDFVLWMDSARVLREHFREQHLVLICNEASAELAKCCGYFDEVLSVDLKAFVSNYFYRWKFVRSVGRLGASIAIQPTYSRRFITGDSLIRSTGAPQCIGSIGDLSNIRGWQRKISDRWYTELVQADSKPMMELERNCEFLRGMGIRNAVPAVATMPQVAKLPSRLVIAHDYFIIFPGASHAMRMWPARKFGELAKAIGRQYNWNLVVCGTRPESELAGTVIGSADMTGSLNLAGMTSLSEFVELVRGAKVLIGNETSAPHIAAAVGTPSVCLLGGGHFDRFMPYSSAVAGMKPEVVFEAMDCFGCNWHCIKPHRQGDAVPCIASIELPAVLEATHRAIASQEYADQTIG